MATKFDSTLFLDLIVDKDTENACLERRKVLFLYLHTTALALGYDIVLPVQVCAADILNDKLRDSLDTPDNTNVWSNMQKSMEVKITSSPSSMQRIFLNSSP